MALRTRSRASSMALLPRPTICRAGRPLVMSLSTSIIWPANPTGATDLIFATLFMLSIVKHIGDDCANCFCSGGGSVGMSVRIYKDIARCSYKIDNEKDAAREMKSLAF